MAYIHTSIRNAVYYLTLQRPDKFNSFIRPMALACQEALSEASSHPDVRCIVLTGEGKAFCAGQDLQEATDPAGPPLSEIVSMHYNPIIHLIRNAPKPVIAAVNGVAAGAGANIALACDLVVCSETASFIQAFSKIGLIPDSGGTFFLPRLIGFHRASAYMMTGDKMTAAEALELGIAYRVFAVDVFQSEVTSLAEKMAAMPTYGLALTKQALNASLGNSLSQQLELEDELQTKAGNSSDYKEGTAAFLEKRSPVFKGC